MGILINKVLTSTGNLPIAANNVVISNIHFPRATVISNDPTIVVKRIITYDLFNYISVNAVQQDLTGNGYIMGGVKEFSSGYTREMTPAEYAAILADGSLAEVWLKDYLESILGAGTCSVINPYA